MPADEEAAADASGGWRSSARALTAAAETVWIAAVAAAVVWAVGWSGLGYAVLWLVTLWFAGFYAWPGLGPFGLAVWPFLNALILGAAFLLLAWPALVIRRCADDG